MPFFFLLGFEFDGGGYCFRAIPKSDCSGSSRFLEIDPKAWAGIEETTTSFCGWIQCARAAGGSSAIHQNHGYINFLLSLLQDHRQKLCTVSNGHLGTVTEHMLLSAHPYPSALKKEHFMLHSRRKKMGVMWPFSYTRTNTELEEFYLYFSFSHVPENVWSLFQISSPSD